MDNNLHEYQMVILRKLLFNPGSRFRDLNSTTTTNDHFSFHVNRLIELNLIEKKTGRYNLTLQGKEFANKMDTDTLNLEKQAKVAVALHAVREVNGEIEILVHKRLKEPFYGWCGSHSGKVRWGETPLDCAKREFREESGLEGDFSLKIIVHYINYYKDGKLLEDKYFFVFRIDNVKGKLIKKLEEGENIWMNKREYLKLEHTFEPYDLIYHDLCSKEIVYEDRVRFIDKY